MQLYRVFKILVFVKKFCKTEKVNHMGNFFPDITEMLPVFLDLIRRLSHENYMFVLVLVPDLALCFLIIRAPSCSHWIDCSVSRKINPVSCHKAVNKSNQIKSTDHDRAKRPPGLIVSHSQHFTDWNRVSWHPISILA